MKKISWTNFSHDTAFWYFYPFRINDLRGDGIVYYNFEQVTQTATGKDDKTEKYYRSNKNFEVISEGKFRYNKEKGSIFINPKIIKKYFWKISPINEIIDIKF